MGALVALAGLLLLVAIHEFGHLIVAKILRFNVVEYSVGFGPQLWSKVIGSTEYSLRMIPLGGYVKIPGLGGQDLSEAELAEWRKRGLPEESFNPNGWFSKKSGWAQFAVLFGGPGINLVTAVFFLAAALSLQGLPGSAVQPLTVQSVSYGAEQAGLQAGDMILEINGTAVNTPEHARDAVEAASGEVSVLFERDGVKQSASILPSDVSDRKLLGLNWQTEVREIGFFESIKYGVVVTAGATVMYVRAIGELFTSTDGLKQISGPLGITSSGSEAVSSGSGTFLMFLWMLSIALAIFNLIPFIPVLDGGQIMFAIYKIFTGKEINFKFRQTATVVGVVMMLGIFLFATFNDLLRIFSGN